MSLESRSNSIKKNHSKPYAAALSDLSPFSTLACQVEATNTWRKDLKSLFTRAGERFADVSWTSGDQDDVSMTDEEGRVPSMRSSPSHRESVVWAHKAILYARAPNSFQARFLQLRTPAINLGGMASSSTVSLPVIRVPSPSSSLRSVTSSLHSKRRTVRGAAPPSSYALLRTASKASTYAGASDSEMEEDFRNGSKVKRNRSSVSLASTNISRPYSRNGRHISKQASYDSVPNTSQPSLRTESDALSVVSTASTVKAPMSLDGVNQVFFESTLEYLYTAEESMKEAFEFLYEDRVAADEGPEERLEKLRQDLVFMWRSRLYSDIQIVIGDEDQKPAVLTIPDNASVTSLVVGDSIEEEEASFSAHRMMLVSRSPYFAAQLLSPYADSDSRIIRLPLPPFTPAALHFTLGFIYTGTLFFSNRTFDLSTAFQLWRSASYLQIETLATLVSSLITHEFCHGFTCLPPCKTCIKRVPRTLAFASSPDVREPRLQTLARNAIGGLDFGNYWSKEVGNLDYTVRGALVSDVCSRIDSNPGYSLYALRQLSIIGMRIDIERNNRWVDAVRWMCESVESHICAIMEARLPDVIASQEWDKLVDGVGFLNDVLEKALSIIIDGLNEERAAKVYEILVGQILLREDRPPTKDIADLVEEARKAIVRYLGKRWVNVRANAGFNSIETWALKELAGEIDVSSNDLLLPLSGRPVAVGPLSKTGLQARVISGDNGNRLKRTPASPGQVVNGEREPGPIHLRAAVLNRNAAKASVVQSRHSGSAPGSNTASNSVLDRPRRSIGPTINSPTLLRQTSQPSLIRPPNNSTPPRSGSTKSGKGKASTPVNDENVASSSSTPRSPSLRTPTASLRSVEREDPDATPTKQSSPSVTAFRSATRWTPPMPFGEFSSTGDVRKRASNASLSSPSTSNTKPPPSSIPRSRQNSASSSTSLSAASVCKNISPSDSATGLNKTIKKSFSSRSVQKRREEGSVPPLPTHSPLVLKAKPQNSIAMQLDEPDAKPTKCLPIGTQLSSGIPCVIAPRNKNGKVTRFRAIVKYIGPLNDDTKPVVGVEVTLPLPSGIEETCYNLHDGSYKGVKYFEIGDSTRSIDGSLELSHKSERQARQLRLAQMMQGRSSTSIDGPLVGITGLELARPSVKRRKDISGLGLDSSPLKSRGLFIQPSEVLWVVI